MSISITYRSIDKDAKGIESSESVRNALVEAFDVFPIDLFDEEKTHATLRALSYASGHKVGCPYIELSNAAKKHGGIRVEADY